jgi:hypothetical protein
MPVIKIKKSEYSGLGHLFDGRLAAVVMGLAAGQALRSASTAADITDSSTGAATGTLAALTAATPAVVGTNDAAQKAALETELTAVLNAIKEIVAQINVVRAKVPAFDALTDSMGGTGADGTIGAISSALTGVGASMASATGFNAVLVTLGARISQAAHYLNHLLTACGQTNLIVSTGSKVTSYSTTFAAVSVSTGSAASGADTTSANAIVKVADANAKLVVLKNSIASMAAKLNALTADANATPVPTVVAVN